MQSFTYMSEEAIKALQDAVEGDDGQPLAFTLNRREAGLFIQALAYAYEADIPRKELSTGEADDFASWSGELLSGLADTYDIEFV